MKRKPLIWIMAWVFLAACKDEPQPIPPKHETLVEIADGQYSEWYPGKKQLKFKGGVDSLGQRDGTWEFFSEQGKMLSMTEYQHGKKNGFSLVKYPNGALHYRGEYQDDEQVGLWTTYDKQGKIIDEKEIKR
ncbi:MAG: hypothetical protein EBR54_01885 [Flavobacteriia bacterium]|nr:hypothetical protein [Flavobacteriia bacterium]NBX38149.1 hypothetical protein [Flavobacteriia bacterium]